MTDDCGAWLPGMRLRVAVAYLLSACACAVRAPQQREAPETPAPLVCSAAPTNFIAVSWTPTCECTSGNQTKVRSDELPCGACYKGRELANYQCRAYDNLIDIADIQGGWGAPGSCAGGAADWAACNSVDFGTFANVSVPCAIDPRDPACLLGGKPLDLSRPGGTATQPFGEKYLLMGFLGLESIMAHPGDALPLTKGACPLDKSGSEEVFTGVWWTHGIAAIAAQSELWFPAYKQAGGQLNELIADWERQMWGPGRCPVPDNSTAAGMKVALACLACAADKWRAVEADERFTTTLAELQTLGFKLNGTLANTMTKFQCVGTTNPLLRPGGMAACNELNGVGAEQANFLAWNAMKERRETDAWVAAMMPAARKAFPAVRLSLYDHWRWDHTHCAVPDVNEGVMSCRVGQGSTGPNVSAPVYYDEWLTFDCLHPRSGSQGVDAPDRCAGTPGLSNTLAKLAKDPSSFNLNFTNFNIARVTINHFRTLALAAAGTTTVLAPWVGFKSFFFDYRCPGDSTSSHDYPSNPATGCIEPDGYWQERVLHFGMAGAARYYYFNVFYECVYNKRSTHEDDDAMSATLAELDIVIGCPDVDRRWITDTALGWGSNFIMSGMNVGSKRRAWRFTPNLPLQVRTYW